MKYNAKSENLPNWAELMYSENPDEGEVIKLYREYYKINKFVKNKHTQYYKNIYGEKTIVLMQVGSFFEVYALKNKEGEIIGSNIRPRTINVIIVFVFLNLFFLPCIF